MKLISRRVVKSNQQAICCLKSLYSFLIEEHGLSFSDLPEIGTPDRIEAILNKKQDLTPSQIQQLAQRFQILPQAFLD